MSFSLVISAVLLSLLAVGNHFTINSPVIAFVLGLIYLLRFGTAAGKSIAPHHTRLIQFIIGSLCLAAALSLLGGLVYRAWNLSALPSTIVIALAPLFVLALHYAFAKRTPLTTESIPLAEPPADIKTTRKTRRLLALIVIGLGLAAISLLINARTVEAIRSPWSVVPNSFFVFIFILNLAGCALLWLAGNNSRSGGLRLLIGLTAISLAVPMIVYEIGYGFDPFIHQATERVIASQGIITPKPWYYLGQYSLVTLSSILFPFDISTIDRFLLPILATLILPLLLLTSIREENSDRRSVALTAAIMLALPLTWFTHTTPQGLANLLFLVIVFLAARPTLWTNTRWWQLTLLCSTATVIHPIAGLPALALLGLTALCQGGRRRRIMAVIVALFLATSLPLLLAIQARGFRAATTLAVLPITRDLSFKGWLYLENRYQTILDSVYYFGFNLPIIILALAACGAILLYRRNSLNQVAPHILTAISLAISGLVVMIYVPQNFLIFYERNTYGLRLIELALFCLLPLVANALLAVLQRLRVANAAPAVLTALLAVAALRTAGLYLTYPRFDGYAFDRGYSTSSHDLAAVRQIEKNARGPYIVLANQAVSAAALQELGFKNYFAGRGAASGEQIFFYPIPTGGTLYQYYLKMVYEAPSRATVKEAMDLTGVNEAYFVLNDYWFDAEKIQLAAKQEADEWQTVDNGNIYIYTYRARK